MSFSHVKIPTSKYNGLEESVTLIDGNNLFYRACLADYKNTELDLTITVSNFAKMFRKTLKNRSKYVAIVFDSGLPTFRHKLLPSYKSNRKTVIRDKELKLRVIRDILHYLGFTIIDSGRYEADDVIGSLAHFLRPSMSVIIHSEDKDFLQCVRSNVTLVKGGLNYGPEMCKLKFGIEPQQFVDYLALMGDAIDCVPGASGWGKKSAQKYLAKCGLIEEILDEKLSKSLQSIHDLDFELMRKLVSIKTNLNVITSVQELSISQRNDTRLYELAKKYHLDIGEFSWQ